MASDSRMTSREAIPRRRPKTAQGDRFINCRRHLDLGKSTFESAPLAARELEVNASPAKEEYKRALAASLAEPAPSQSKVLHFGAAVRRQGMREEPLRQLFNINR